MSDLQNAQLEAANFLAPTTDARWHWTPDGLAIVWSDGRTIAFRQQVEHVIQRLAPRGLPPIGSIILMLAACRDGWLESDARNFVSSHGTQLTDSARRAAVHVPHSPFALAAAHIEKLLAGLDRISTLPANLRSSKEAQATLAETIFEIGAKALTSEKSAAVVRALSDGVNPESLAPRFTVSDSFNQFTTDADALLPGVRAVTEESLTLRAQTSLDTVIEEADVELSPSERVRNLLKELQSDTELSGLAKLAQNIMAAVHVPRNLHHPEELPLGGVSDLSNRGSLDRLLISELANDELTLAVRVAMNEALYLRRESPPKQPPNHRAILLDLGIRLWGIPRVFAIAGALAMVATADRKSQIATYRAAGSGIAPIDLTTRAGVIACMGILEPHPHPGDALRAFAEKIGTNSDVETDSMIITHADVLPDPAFTQPLKPLQEEGIYLATVSNTGDFEFLAASSAGRKLVSKAKMDLGVLFAEPIERSTPLIVGPTSGDFPAILSVERFPFRLSYALDPGRAASSKKHGLVGATNDGRILHWSSEERGAKQLTATVPPGAARAIRIDDETGFAYLLIVSKKRHGPMYLAAAQLEAATAEIWHIAYSGPAMQTVEIIGGVPVLISATTAIAIDPKTGRVLTRLVFPKHTRWFGGRYFMLPNRAAHALSYAANQLQLQPMPSKSNERGYLVVRFFDRPGHDGAWAVLTTGAVTNWETGEGIRSRKFLSIRSAEISTDGSTLIGQVDNREMVLHLDSATSWEDLRTNRAVELFGPQIWWRHGKRGGDIARCDHLFTNANREFCARLGNLTYTLSCIISPPVLSWGFKTPQLKPDLPEPVKVESPPGTRYRLLQQSWPDGSKAWIDSRGLLHLRSSDRTLPEISLTLTVYQVAGWTSDGRKFGSPAYFDEGSVVQSFEELLTEVNRFIARLR